jgi:hypothetical protein
MKAHFYNQLLPTAKIGLKLSLALSLFFSCYAFLAEILA